MTWKAIPNSHLGHTTCNGHCGNTIVVVEEHAHDALCSGCLMTRINETLVMPPGTVKQWTPPRTVTPPEPVYPPSSKAAIAPFLTDVEAVCINHRHPVHLALTEDTPEAIARAYYIHDHVFHKTGTWLIGGPGGANGDICNPCGGGNRQGGPLEGGPRHDLCLKGRTRGRGNDCPCTHDKPYMRGIKPGKPGTRP